ncbi:MULTISPECIES: isochorismate synthase [Spirulina sp. CCY15215]|uniref:isochorismate synthase n=1 Tax=Spirulina sp. CCY15215 TaxID=2767591 RepID=UPI00194F3488|nr:isochorismate synthase [Spirulina major]
MVVKSQSIDLLQEEKAIYQFLYACYEQYCRTNIAKIASFSQPLNDIDPLAAFQCLLRDDRQHFYWEHPKTREAVFGHGAVKLLEIDSSDSSSSGDRFVRTRNFMQDCLKQIVYPQSSTQSEANPYFFSSFTFFPTSNSIAYPFPVATIFLPQFQVIRKNNCCFFVANIAITKTLNIKLAVEEITRTIKKICQFRLNILSSTPQPQTYFNLQEKIRNEDNFKIAVKSALQSIQKHQLSKIVLAHPLDLISPVPFRIIESLQNLRQNYPNCYLFAIGNDRGYRFIGASPERAIGLQNQQLITDALAGSAPRGKTPREDTQLAQQLLKSEKDKREHQAVSEFILQCLEKLGLQVRRSPLQVLQLDNIQHLHVQISARVPQNLHPLDIVAKLHPTPAVAGVPTQIACDRIRRYENFDRALYAAPLGWVDARGNSEFIVGIRSAAIAGDRARLYAGAGIVAGSDPERELAEVRLKLQAMRRALI